MQLVLLCMAQKWLALSLPACAGLVYVIQRVYLRTSRQLRFLELESRAAVLSTFLESVSGIPTIATQILFRVIDWFLMGRLTVLKRFERSAGLVKLRTRTPRALRYRSGPSSSSCVSSGG